MNERMNEWMNDWMNDWMNEWLTEWMNERMNKWMNEWISDPPSMPMVESSFQTQFGAEVPHMTPTSMALKTTVLCRAKSTLKPSKADESCTNEGPEIHSPWVHPKPTNKNVFFRCFWLHELKHIQSTKVDSTCRSCEWSNNVMYGSLCRLLCKTSSFHHMFLHMQPTHYLPPIAEVHHSERRQCPKLV